MSTSRIGGLRGYLSRNLRGRKGQQGFTLIELLVVVTILGVLAAIVTLSLVGLTTNASVQSCNQEYKTVQAAIDAAMANNNLDTINVQNTATNDMTLVLWTTANGPIKLYNPNLAPSPGGPVVPANYTRNGKTQFFYTWDTFGKINSIVDSNGKPINGCSVT